MAGLKVFTGSLWRAVGVEDSQWDILTANETGGAVELSWPTAGGSPSSYEVSIGNNIINVGNANSYLASGLTIGQKYNIKVRPVYSDGSTGGWSYFKNRGPTGMNSATGGTITTVSNYNGTGETWKVHTFTSNGTFSITENYGLYPFRVLVVGGGSGSTGNCGGPGVTRCGGNGGGGQVYQNNSILLSASSYSVTVGNAGAGGGNVIDGATGPAGQSSSIAGVASASGGTYQGSNPVISNNISGSSTNYSGVGGNRGSGAEAGCAGNWCTGGYAGTAGIVIISYRIS